MRPNFVAAGLFLLGIGLVGWAALAPAQPPVAPEPVAPTALPTALPTTAVAPVAPADSVPGLTITPGTALPGSPAVGPSPAVGSPGLPGGGVATPGAMPATTPVTPATPATPENPIETTVTQENTTGRQEPAVSLEWIGPPTAKVGQPGDYSLVIRNVSNIPVQKVVVQARIPAGLTVTACEPKSATTDNVLMWELGTLMAKQEKNLMMKLVAASKGDITPQAWVTFTGSSVMKIRVREPKLTVKVAAMDKVMIGDPATFTVTVTNPGDGSADQVKIHAVLSEGLASLKGTKPEFDIGNLAAGESRSVQVVCDTKVGGMQKCEATADAENGLLNCRDSAGLNVITPRLDLVLDGPGLRYLERKALYVLKVTNPGDAPATNVTVSDVVPDGFKVLAATDGGRHDFSTRTVSWFLGEVGPNQTREVKFEVQAINTGEHLHKATAIGARGLRAEAEKMTRVEGVSALMVEMVDTEDPIEAGGDTAYEVRISNTGSKTETDIRLIATVPDKMEFKDARGPARYRVEGKNIVFEPIEKLAPRADALFRINVKAVEPGTVSFKIQMTSSNITEPQIKMEPTRIYSDAPEVGRTPAKPPM